VLENEQVGGRDHKECEQRRLHSAQCPGGERPVDGQKGDRKNREEEGVVFKFAVKQRTNDHCPGACCQAEESRCLNYRQAHLHSKPEDEHPQETGISFHAFARVENEAVAVPEILRVAEDDVGILVGGVEVEEMQHRKNDAHYDVPDEFPFAGEPQKPPYEGRRDVSQDHHGESHGWSFRSVSADSFGLQDAQAAATNVYNMAVAEPSSLTEHRP